MRKSVIKLASLGKASIGANKEEFKKIVKEAAHEAKKVGKERLKDKAHDAAIKFVAEFKDNSDAAMAAAGNVADAWEKIHAPSFWANTAVQLLDGKSWSDAVTKDIGEDIDERIKFVQAQSDRQSKLITDKRDRLASQLKETEKIDKEISDSVKINRP